MKRTDPNYYDFSDNDMKIVKQSIERFFKAEYSAILITDDKKPKVVCEIDFSLWKDNNLFQNWDEAKHHIVRLILSLPFEANYSRAFCKTRNHSTKVDFLHFEIIKQ